MVSGSIKFPSTHPHLETNGQRQRRRRHRQRRSRARPASSPAMEMSARPPASRHRQGSRRGKLDRQPRPERNPSGRRESLPRSGLLYFYFRGKIKNIHSLDLFYEGTMGKATLKLLP